MMVPYAGYDSTENRRRFGKPERALFMFRNGKDTQFIAEYFGIREATALRWITTERSLSMGLKSPYGGSA